MPEKSSIFDMIGPVMIGPSSSHTAGVVKIGRTAVRVLGSIPKEVEITFYNSFAKTYEGHGSDRAIIAGLLDMATDDARIKDAFEHAKKDGLKYSFKSIGNASTLHPNSVKIRMNTGERWLEIIGVSLGGGVITIKEVNGFTAGFNGDLFTLLVLAEDRKGSIAFISAILSNEGANIATMSVTRSGRNQMACLVIEIDDSIRPLTLEYLLSLSWVDSLRYVEPIGE